MQLREYRIRELETLIPAKLKEIEEAEKQLDDCDSLDFNDVFKNEEKLGNELGDLWVELESLDRERAEAIEIERYNVPMPKLTETELQLREYRIKELETLIPAKLKALAETEDQLNDVNFVDSDDVWENQEILDNELAALRIELEDLDPERAKALEKNLVNMSTPTKSESESQLEEEIQRLKSSKDNWSGIAIFAIFLLLCLLISIIR